MGKKNRNWVQTSYLCRGVFARILGFELHLYCTGFGYTWHGSSHHSGLYYCRGSSCSCPYPDGCSPHSSAHFCSIFQHLFGFDSFCFFGGAGGSNGAQADYIKTSWRLSDMGCSLWYSFLFAFNSALMALSRPMDILWTSIVTLFCFIATASFMRCHF